jgi:hypothetical protein
MNPVTFFNITDPFNMEATPEPETHDSSTPTAMPRSEERDTGNYTQVTFDDAPGLAALSTAAASNYDYLRPLSNPACSPGGTIIPLPSSNNLNFILNPAVPEGRLGMNSRLYPISKAVFADPLCKVLCHHLRLIPQWAYHQVVILIPVAQTRSASTKSHFFCVTSQRLPGNGR